MLSATDHKGIAFDVFAAMCRPQEPGQPALHPADIAAA